MGIFSNALLSIPVVRIMWINFQMDYVKPFLLAAIACISGGIVLNPDVVKLFVGQPFQYAFQTSSRAFEVRDASGEELPTWLIWNSNER